MTVARRLYMGFGLMLAILVAVTVVGMLKVQSINSALKANSQERHDAPVFVGSTTLVASIWTTLRARELTAVVHYTEAQTAAGRDRRAWAQDLHQALSRVL